MPLPRFAWKSALLFLAGVAAVLVTLYFILTALFNSPPYQRVTPNPAQLAHWGSSDVLPWGSPEPGVFYFLFSIFWDELRPRSG
jgi:hypothetical protein